MSTKELGKYFVVLKDCVPAGSKGGISITFRAGDYFQIAEVQEAGFRVMYGSVSAYVADEDVVEFGMIVDTKAEAEVLTASDRERRFFEKFGYEQGCQFIGKVTTSNFTKEGFGSQTTWEVYFKAKSKRIEICHLGCNGTRFTGRLKDDGSTTLDNPELDSAVRQLLEPYLTG
jgi:hypothetical protein